MQGSGMPGRMKQKNSPYEWHWIGEKRARPKSRASPGLGSEGKVKEANRNHCRTKTPAAFCRYKSFCTRNLRSISWAIASPSPFGWSIVDCDPADAADPGSERLTYENVCL